jgi:hypothetical protein
MTLEETIRREEALAYSFGERYKRLGEPVGNLKELEAEHRQMAEWLRELKIHRVIHDALLQFMVDSGSDICCDELMNDENEKLICEENCENQTKNCWVRWAKLTAREVNADEDSD